MKSVTFWKKIMWYINNLIPLSLVEISDAAC